MGGILRASTRRRSNRILNAAFAALLSIAAASCMTNDPSLQTALSGSNGSGALSDTTVPAMMAEVAATQTGSSPGQPSDAAHSDDAAAPAAVTPQTSPAINTAAEDAGDFPLLPQEVAYVPTESPAAPFAIAANSTPAQTAGNEDVTPVSAGQIPTNKIPEPTPAPRPAEPFADSGTGQPAVVDTASATAFADTRTAAPETTLQKRGFFATLFGSPQNLKSTPAPLGGAHAAPMTAEAQSAPMIQNSEPAQPIVRLASAEKSEPLHSLTGSDALPGVRSDGSLFEITRRSGIGDNNDVDINEDAAPPDELASAAGMARLDPNGMLLQRETVDTACLKPALLAVLKQVEQHYGRKLVITSGFRSPVHNAAAHGALNSLHMYCAAADVQLPGVSKWDLASYARSMPGRGGVGTYCHTKSVHIDIGPERDWNWRCRRRRHRS